MEIDKLKKQLKGGKTTDERRDAAQALGTIGNEDFVSFLIECFEKEEDNGVKSKIIQALGKIGGPEAIDFLNKIRKDEEKLVPMVMTSLALLEALDRTLSADKVIKSAESTTEKLEKLKGEADLSASVTISTKKIDEITTPLKEELKKYKDKEEREQERQTVKDSLRKEMEEKYPEIVYGMPHFKDYFKAEMRRYDDKLSRLEKQITEYTEERKHQETLSLSKRQINVAIIAIVVSVIISVASIVLTLYFALPKPP